MFTQADFLQCRNLLSIVQTRRLAANSTLNPDKLHQLQQNHPIQAPWVERKEKQNKKTKTTSFR